MKKHAKKIAASLLIALTAFLIIISASLYARYGGGTYYPDLSGEPVLAKQALEEAARYHEPIGNIAVNQQGRLFFTVHPESRPEKIKVLEWKQGKATPYPSEEAQAGFDTVLGMAIDRQDRLWIIDHGNHGTATAKLIAIDLTTNKIIKTHTFSSEVAPVGSFLQDLNISPDGKWAYVADVSFWRKSPGLVVVNLETGKERRVLDAHKSVMPMDYIIRNPIKEMVFFGGLVALKPGVDGIAISADGKTLAFAAMAHDTTYTIKTDLLHDFDRSDAEIEKHLVAVGKKPLNDGLSYDTAGNILITDVEHSAVVRQKPDGSLETLVKDERIRWADALSHGPGKSLYIADSAIPHQMLQSKTHIKQNAPYFIWKVESDIAGVAGQ